MPSVHPTPMFYHVRFATKIVGPLSLPEYAYTCVEVGFDTISYVAVVHATSVAEAVQQVKALWPDAVPYRVVRNQMFLYEDYKASIMRLGFVDKAPIEQPDRRWGFFRFFNRNK